MSAAGPFDGLPTPAAVESERALLGCILQDPEVLTEVMGRIEVNDFYRPEHAALYELLCGMHTDGAPILNPEALSLRIRRNGGWDRFGGASYVVELPEHAPSTLGARHYVDDIARTAAYRRMVQAGLDLMRAGYEQRDEPNVVLDSHVSKLTEIGPRRRSETVMHISEAIDYAKKRRAEGKGKRVSTNIPELDRRLAGGLYPGNLVVVGARPSWGKTGFAIGVVLDHALSGGRAGICSLEEEVDDITWRVLSQVSGVPGEVVQDESLQTDEDRDKLAQAEEVVRRIGLEIDATSASTMADILRTCQRWKAAGGLDIVAIDYLGLIRHGKAENQRQAIGATLKNCKHIAKTLQIPVLLCVQLNRDALETKPGSARGATEWWHRVPQPQLHHMKDTGDIEQDADKVIFPIPAAVLVDQGYAPRDLGTTERDAIIFVAKCRRGKIGAVPAIWNGPTASYHAAEPAPARPQVRIVGGRDYHDTELLSDDEPL